jgi:lysophospholipase
MPLLNNAWLNREQSFSAYTTGPLLRFWQQREEGTLLGGAGVELCYVCFRDPHHHQVIFICTGRTESYVKYAELAFDLFYQGYDVMILDHRGQGRSARLSTGPHMGHVERFDDYVDDFALFCRHLLSRYHYPKRFLLGHSMGGTIGALLLSRYADDALLQWNGAVLCAPMFSIHLPLPEWLAYRLLNWIERHPARRNHYVLGSGHWQPLPFVVNRLTHSRVRYRRTLRIFADNPQLRIGGPSYHWVRESLLAGRRVLVQAKNIHTPLLLLQAEDERVVGNHAQIAFCQAMKAAGNPCYGGMPLVIQGARHEILFERDEQRVQALDATLRFFAQQR